MGLGRIGLDDFTPKASGTATHAIKVSLQSEQKKTATLQLRINEDVYTLFKELCKKSGVEVSAALRAYINAAIDGGVL